MAIRRADAFASAVSSKGVEGGEFWAQKSSDYLRALFFAAGYARRRGEVYGLATAARWALTGSSREAEEILVDAGLFDWAAQIQELRGAAEKTAATIRMYMSHALGFLMDPALASAVTPDPDDPGLDLESFARGHDSLYMIATGQGEKSPLAPLFACIASEIHFTAGMVGSYTAAAGCPTRCCSPWTRSPRSAPSTCRAGWPTPAAAAFRSSPSLTAWPSCASGGATTARRSSWTRSAARSCCPGSRTRRYSRTSATPAAPCRCRNAASTTTRSTRCWTRP